MDYTIINNFITFLNLLLCISFRIEKMERILTCITLTSISLWDIFMTNTKKLGYFGTIFRQFSLFTFLLCFYSFFFPSLYCFLSIKKDKTKIVTKIILQISLFFLSFVDFMMVLIFHFVTLFPFQSHVVLRLVLIIFFPDEKIDKLSWSNFMNELGWNI